MRELQEALEGLLTEDESVRLNVQVLAPIIETALRAAVEKLQQIYDIPLDDVEAKKEVERCVTAGVAAMVEGL